LAEQREIDGGAQASSDQALDLFGATTDLPFSPVALLAARGVRARVHLVLGGDPALAAALEPVGHTVFDRSGAEDARIPGAIEDGALAHSVEAGFDGDGSNAALVEASAFIFGHERGRL